MNRIILIGNGFDLAHGLKTSYKNFMDWYWDEWIERLRKSTSYTQTDDLCKFIYKDHDTNWYTFFYTYFSSFDKLDWKQVLSKMEESAYINIIACHFLQNICKSIEYNNWVDIEMEYYNLLKKRTICSDEYNSSHKELNEQLDSLKTKLCKYLKSLSINKELIKNSVTEKIYCPITPCDISINDKDGFISHIEHWMNTSKEEWAYRFRQYDTETFDQDATFEDLERIKKEANKDLFNDSTYKRFPKEILYPDNILLLNFNYTNTAKLYLKEKSGFELNHIHGSLENPNGIIFGYGDEMDDEYPVIKKRNDNELLKNMKTIRYSETDNYRKMLSFIESAPYQIFIMGHSCGNSDRTLLNTLFEHDNCVSIKPYYHKKEDGTDNYIELVQNISRNFTDMKKMRDRVVNKTYCEPLVGEK